MNTDLYNRLAEKAKDHAAREGLSDEWAYGFLNAMWPTIEASDRSITADGQTGHEAHQNGSSTPTSDDT